MEGRRKGGAIYSSEREQNTVAIDIAKVYGWCFTSIADCDTNGSWW